MTTQEILDKLPSTLIINELKCGLMMYKCLDFLGTKNLYYAGYRKFTKPYGRNLSYGASNRVGFFESTLDDAIKHLYQEMIELKLIS